MCLMHVLGYVHTRCGLCSPPVLVHERVLQDTSRGAAGRAGTCSLRLLRSQSRAGSGRQGRGRGVGAAGTAGGGGAEAARDRQDRGGPVHRAGPRGRRSRARRGVRLICCCSSDSQRVRRQGRCFGQWCASLAPERARFCKNKVRSICWPTLGLVIRKSNFGDR